MGCKKHGLQQEEEEKEQSSTRRRKRTILHKKTPRDKLDQTWAGFGYNSLVYAAHVSFGLHGWTWTWTWGLP